MENTKCNEFWCTYLDGADSSTQLHADNIFHSDHKNICIYECTLINEYFENIGECEKRFGVSITTVLCAAWAVLLQKYSHSEDVIFGIQLNNSKIDKLRPIRINEYENTTIQNYLAKLEDTIDEIRNLDGEKLNSILIGTNDDYSHYENNLSFMLNVCIKENSKISFNYDANLFNKSTITKIEKHLYNIIAYIENNLSGNYLEIDMLSDEETLLILNKINNTWLPFENINKTVDEIIEDIAKETPSNIALVCQGNNLTYKNFNEKSNQLARVLRSMGVKPGEVVALIMERSIELFIGILAVMKAGGAYLPLDPSYPSKRISYVLENSKISCIISKSNINLKFDEPIIYIDDESLFNDQSVSNLERWHSPEDLIYILYTSGSTGKPKGVMVKHINVLGYINTFIHTVHAKSTDVVLQSTSISFDISVEEMFSAFLTGAKLLISDNYVLQDIDRLMDFVNENKISRIDTFPLLVNEINKLNVIPPTLKVIISGGDVLRYEYIDRIVDKVKIFNSYGPSETTVCATYHECKPGERIIPIGKVLGNYKIYILDKNKKLLPIGVPGEIYISGIGVSKGYYNNPTITEQRFLPDIFDKDKIMFRTGDCGKWLSEDGSIQFLGRLDGQLKVGGYRTEIDEVEKVLLSYRPIKEAIILVKEKENKSKFLCAYVVSDKFNPHQLKSYLSKFLPEFMVPEYIFSLSRIPVTFNGKINTKKLLEIPIHQMTKMPKYKMLLNGESMRGSNLLGDPLHK